MKLEHYSPKKLKKEIKDIVNKYIKDCDVFFFGSRVRGDNFERADIDIGLKIKGEIPLDVLGKIKEEAGKLPTLYKIDIIDFGRASREFREEAMKNIEYV